MMRRAFTLIELLVVISIIALLIAILLPALAAARKSATNTQCKVNLRSIVQASAAYEADFGKYPERDLDVVNKQTYIKVNSAYDLRLDLDGYIDFNLLQCPFSEQLDLHDLNNSSSIIESSYAMFFGWGFDGVYNGKEYEQMTSSDKRFTYRPATGLDHAEFDVLAMDSDANKSTGDGSETSHPSEGAETNYQENIPANLNAFSRYDSVGQPRDNIDVNYARVDASVETYNAAWDYGTQDDFSQIPTFSTSVFQNFWYKLPTAN